MATLATAEMASPMLSFTVSLHSCRVESIAAVRMSLSSCSDDDFAKCHCDGCSSKCDVLGTMNTVVLKCSREFHYLNSRQTRRLVKMCSICEARSFRDRRTYLFERHSGAVRQALFILPRLEKKYRYDYTNFSVEGMSPAPERTLP